MLSASTLEPPAGVSSTTTPTPIAWDLDDRYLEDIRAVTATHSTALQDLGSDLNILSNAFRQFRGETAHVSSDLHTLSDQFLHSLQRSSYRANDQLHQDTSVRLALQMESNTRAQSDRQDATRDELRSTLQLFATSVDTKMDEMRSILTSAMTQLPTDNTTHPLATSRDARREADEPEVLGSPTGFPPTVVGAGADRFTLPPFGRGRALGASRPQNRLRHPETAGIPRQQPHPALLDTAHRPHSSRRVAPHNATPAMTPIIAHSATAHRTLTTSVTPPTAEPSTYPETQGEESENANQS